jgi:hypothetical protein
MAVDYAKTKQKACGKGKLNGQVQPNPKLGKEARKTHVIKGLMRISW